MNENTATVGPDELLAALGHRLDPVPVSLLYRFGLLCVAAAMVLLPLLYLAAIAAVGWLVYLHAVHNFSLFSGSGGGRILLLKATVYAAPIVAGLVTVVFMFKPILARPARPPGGLEIRPADQPLLFRFVDALTAAVGAPMPTRIVVDCQVNASASFHRGLRSFFGNDLLLTVGLPLITGLSLRQFAGILAHEFGHFAQGGAMRLTYLIRSISNWFARVVYERDRWDERLDEWGETSPHWTVSLVLQVTRLAVWSSRRILWVLMAAGNLISCFMLRQMEFDADRYEARLAGSGSFASTCLRLVELSTGWQGAVRQLQRTYSEGRLADDLPTMITDLADRIPAESVEEMHREALGEKAGLFATHPAHAERIASAEAEDATGIFRFEQPAALLFRDLPGLSRRVTRHHYEALEELDLSGRDLVSTDELLADEAREEASFRAAKELFGEGLRSLAPLSIAAGSVRSSSEPADDLAAVQAARDEMAALASDAASAVEGFHRASERLLAAEAAGGLLESGQAIDAESFELPSADLEGVEQVRARAGLERTEAATALERFEAIAGKRLTAALRLLHTPRIAARIPESAELETDCPLLVDAQACLAEASEKSFELQLGMAKLGNLVAWAQQQRLDEATLDQIQKSSKATRATLAALRQGLSEARHPFAHPRGERTLAEVLIEDLPTEPMAVAATAHAVAQELPFLHFRVLGRLASIALQVERVAAQQDQVAPDREEG